VINDSGDHAIVLGASMAGLLSARVLAGVYQRVTIVERDPLPEGSLDRKGVPQARHAHALLARGGQVLDELFPGLLDKMAADGVPQNRGADQVWHEFNGHVMCRTGVLRDRPSFQPSRPYLEARIRDEVRGMPNVVIRDDCAALGPVASASRDRVTGVRLAPRGGAEELVLADLVVDATGRGGRTPTWLRELGYDAPEEEDLAVDLVYASRRVRLRPGALGAVRLVLIGGTPGRPRGMGFIEQEHDHFTMTVGGYAGHHPPTDHEGFLAFAESIVPEVVSTALGDAQWLDDPRRHRFPASRRRHYERLRRFPVGLVVVGDAMCSFNPLFGQGMTVAALEAVALRDALAAGQDNLAGRYFASAAKYIDTPWQMAVSSDRAQLGLPQPVAERIAGRYVRRLQAAARHDPVLAAQFSDVAGLMKPPAALFKPAVVLRVLAGNLRRSPSPSPRPTGAPTSTGPREPGPGS
jgi:2-polyprenyl-6-methoxyphenol hydroxylase-like FAD-dependent oxidoreductase